VLNYAAQSLALSQESAFLCANRSALSGREMPFFGSQALDGMTRSSARRESFSFIREFKF
jgi:hypothetical protein